MHDSVVDRPLIAIPSRFSHQASALRHRAMVGSRNLIAAVWAAGGEPLLVHPVAPDGVADDAEVAARLRWASGILLPGGGDLAAHWSGQPDHPTLYDVDVEQDAFDLAVGRYALAAGVPLLAVCRGTQVVNVLRGGTLVQDMDEHDSELSHHRNHVHHISVDAGTRAGSILGEAVEVSCYHHQCLDRLGEGLVVTARSEEGVIEAVELPELASWFLGIQWHPEDTWENDPQQLTLLRAFVAAARRGGS